MPKGADDSQSVADSDASLRLGTAVSVSEGSLGRDTPARLPGFRTQENDWETPRHQVMRPYRPNWHQPPLQQQQQPPPRVTQELLSVSSGNYTITPLHKPPRAEPAPAKAGSASGAAFWLGKGRAKGAPGQKLGGGPKTVSSLASSANDPRRALAAGKAGLVRAKKANGTATSQPATEDSVTLPSPNQTETPPRKWQQQQQPQRKGAGDAASQLAATDDSVALPSPDQTETPPRMRQHQPLQRKGAGAAAKTKPSTNTATDGDSVTLPSPNQTETPPRKWQQQPQRQVAGNAASQPAATEDSVTLPSPNRTETPPRKWQQQQQAPQRRVASNAASQPAPTDDSVTLPSPNQTETPPRERRQPPQSEAASTTATTAHETPPAARLSSDPLANARSRFDAALRQNDLLGPRYGGNDGHPSSASEGSSGSSQTDASSSLHINGQVKRRSGRRRAPGGYAAAAAGASFSSKFKGTAVPSRKGRESLACSESTAASNSRAVRRGAARRGRSKSTDELTSSGSRSCSGSSSRGNPAGLPLRRREGQPASHSDVYSSALLPASSLITTLSPSMIGITPQPTHGRGSPASEDEVCTVEFQRTAKAPSSRSYHLGTQYSADPSASLLSKGRPESLDVEAAVGPALSTTRHPVTNERTGKRARHSFCSDDGLSELFASDRPSGTTLTRQSEQGIPRQAGSPGSAAVDSSIQLASSVSGGGLSLKAPSVTVSGGGGEGDRPSPSSFSSLTAATRSTAEPAGKRQRTGGGQQQPLARVDANALPSVSGFSTVNGSSGCKPAFAPPPRTPAASLASKAGDLPPPGSVCSFAAATPVFQSPASHYHPAGSAVSSRQAARADSTRTVQSAGGFSIFNSAFTPLRPDAELAGPAGCFPEPATLFPTQQDEKNWEEQQNDWVSGFNAYIAEVDQIQL
ncbi:hypothetical protein DIPPA_32007 [Diplonema papillatum]|nr:hypothetical protein DIPPA_32007 [Diplonema papillatum]